MISTVLTVCTGNICRSPLAEAVLRDRLDGVDVSSAGLHAVVGHGMDEDSAAAARQLGVPLAPHKARQFTAEIGAGADLIIVMETHHRHEIAQTWPHLLGKTFLMGHFAGGAEVPDPYRLPPEQHIRAAELIVEFSAAWEKQIGAMRR